MNIIINEQAHAVMSSYKLNELDMAFGKNTAPVMIKAEYINNQWGDFELIPYGPLQIDPCAKVLHYGQEIFEGMKAYKTPENKLQLFRPYMNAKRFNHSAQRMGMATINEDHFVKAVATITNFCNQIVPKRLGESLYLRPFMIATEVGLGIRPANHFTFIIIASPSGAYFAGNSVKVLIERKDARAIIGGTGTAKTGVNYAASLQSYKKTISLGYDQTLWLDAIEHRYIEEMSGMNFFAVINGELHTPKLTGTILEGITRDSILTLARNREIKVFERSMDISELLEDIKTGKCSEAFVCGTASIVAPIYAFYEEDGTSYEIQNAKYEIAIGLREDLLNIQAGLEEAPFEDWIYNVDI